MICHHLIIIHPLLPFHENIQSLRQVVQCVEIVSSLFYFIKTTITTAPNNNKKLIYEKNTFCVASSERIKDSKNTAPTNFSKDVKEDIRMGNNGPDSYTPPRYNDWHRDRDRDRDRDRERDRRYRDDWRDMDMRSRDRDR